MTNQEHPFQRAKLGLAPFRVAGYELCLFQIPGHAPRAGSSCDYCGTAIANVFWIKSSDGKKFKVGCDCVAKTGDVKLVAEVKASQKERRAQAKQARDTARREAERLSAAERFARLPAELHKAFNDCDHPIVHSIAERARKRGYVTPGQADLTLRLYAEFCARRDQVGCALPPLVEAPRTVSRIEIVGTILATKIQESFYGDTLKMLVSVRTPWGYWKAWSTVPQAAHDQKRAEGREYLKGMTIRMVARVEVSKDDPTFAFLSRPTIPKGKPAKAKRERAAVAA